MFRFFAVADFDSDGISDCVRLVRLCLKETLAQGVLELLRLLSIAGMIYTYIDIHMN